MGVTGLIRCWGACDRQSNVFLRFKLGGINGLGVFSGIPQKLRL